MCASLDVSVNLVNGVVKSTPRNVTDLVKLSRPFDSFSYGLTSMKNNDCWISFIAGNNDSLIAIADN